MGIQPAGASGDFTIRRAQPEDLYGAAVARVASWRAFYSRYGFIETPDRTHSSLNNLPEIRLRLQ